MIFCAWFAIVGSGLAVLLIPFSFGKSEGIYTPLKWIGNVLEFVLNLALAGRVLGWW